MPVLGPRRTKPTGPLLGPVTVAIREVRWEDFHPLVENYFSYYDELTDEPGLGLILFAEKPSLADEAAWFLGLYRSQLAGDQVALVAEVDGRPVGLVQVRRGLPHPETGHVGDLGISIHRDHRGKGLGTRLLREALRRCRGRFEVVNLRVFADNERAKALYRKMGFVTVGRVPKAVHRGGRYFDEEIMHLDLGRAPPEGDGPSAP